MHISAKTEYACIAVLELAAQYGSGRPVQLRRIAQAQGIPPQFLVQILLQLKAGGLVGSTRGSAGGYQLMQDPAFLTLGNVMNLIEPQSTERTSNASRVTPTSRVLLEAWQGVADVERRMLEGITFGDLVKRIQQPNENMYYI